MCYAILCGPYSINDIKSNIKFLLEKNQFTKTIIKNLNVKRKGENHGRRKTRIYGENHDS